MKRIIIFSIVSLSYGNRSEIKERSFYQDDKVTIYHEQDFTEYIKDIEYIKDKQEYKQKWINYHNWEHPKK